MADKEIPISVPEFNFQLAAEMAQKYGKTPEEILEISLNFGLSCFDVFDKGGDVFVREQGGELEKIAFGTPPNLLYFPGVKKP